MMIESSSSEKGISRAKAFGEVLISVTKRAIRVVF
jgi:hypothetical protein